MKIIRFLLLYHRLLDEPRRFELRWFDRLLLLLRRLLVTRTTPPPPRTSSYDFVLHHLALRLLTLQHLLVLHLLALCLLALQLRIGSNDRLMVQEQVIDLALLIVNVGQTEATVAAFEEQLRCPSALDRELLAVAELNMVKLADGLLTTVVQIHSMIGSSFPVGAVLSWIRKNE